MPESNFTPQDAVQTQPDSVEPKGVSTFRKLLDTKMTRRRTMGLAGSTALGAGLLVACGPGGEPISSDPSATAAPDVPPTSVPTVEPIPTPEIKRDPNSLRELATNRGIEIGMQGTDVFLKRDLVYRDILPKEFNMTTVAGPLLWEAPGSSTGATKALRPGPDAFDFSTADNVVNLAKKNDMTLEGHHLVWGDFLPSWLLNGGYSRDQISGILENHIRTVVGNYSTPDKKIDRWSVVNEPVAAKMGWGKPQLSFWYKNLGVDFVNEMAFRWANESDPTAKLFINESFYYHNQGENVTNTIVNEVSSMARNLINKKVPIHAIGMQMHLRGLNPPTVDRFVKDMKLFQAMGLEVLVTEFDVDMTGVPGSKEEREAKQAQIYADLLSAYLRNGGRSFALFGINDKLSWYNDMGLKESEATPFDSQYRKKPAYTEMQKVLQAIPEARTR